MNRAKVKRFIKIRWDNSYRMRFVGKSEDDQITELMEVRRQNQAILLVEVSNGLHFYINDYKKMWDFNNRYLKK